MASSFILHHKVRIYLPWVQVFSTSSVAATTTNNQNQKSFEACNIKLDQNTLKSWQKWSDVNLLQTIGGLLW
jgi:hypothetical protein